MSASIKAKAQVIVTHNLKDFPSEVLWSWDVEAKSPDQFVLDQIDLEAEVVWEALIGMSTARINPSSEVPGILAELEREAWLLPSQWSADW